MKVSKTDPVVAAILRATYPDYRGRKVFLSPQTSPLNCSSYWDGGSRSYFKFVRLDTFKTAEMPAQSAFDRTIRGADAVTLPPGIICVEHAYFCGNDCGITIHANRENLVSLLPAGDQERVKALEAKYGEIPAARLLESLE